MRYLRSNPGSSDNSLCNLSALGQSIWVDDLSRSLVGKGELKALIENDGITGLTSNPVIFEKAINGSDDYDVDIAWHSHHGSTPATTLRSLMLGDVRNAADLLRPVYDLTRSHDGFVSMEVSPSLAHDAEGTYVEASELWAGLDRENVMIKIPATRAALPVIRRLIFDGVNINVTLLFGLSRYQEVCEAWLAGLEDRLRAGKGLHRVTSVASFFVSRIDSRMDPLVRAAEEDHRFASASGKIAISSAKLAHHHLQQIKGSRRFLALAREGARIQRLLWASTGTKDPAYPDTKYVEALIGEDTITTLPIPTLLAYKDHGKPAWRLREGLGEARALLDSLPALGINLEAQVAELEKEGILKFVEAHETLLESLRVKGERIRAGALT